MVLYIAAPNSNNKLTTNIAASNLNQNTLLLLLSSLPITYNTTKMITTLTTNATTPVTT